MKLRREACLFIACVAVTLSGCVRSCFNTDDTVLNQVSFGDSQQPEVVISKFPVLPAFMSSGCETVHPVRVELFIDTSGYARGVTFLDQWSTDCANEYVRNIERFKLLDTPLLRPLEHFRVDLQYSRVSRKQCIKLNP